MILYKKSSDISDSSDSSNSITVVTVMTVVTIVTVVTVVLWWKNLIKKNMIFFYETKIVIKIICDDKKFSMKKKTR